MEESNQIKEGEGTVEKKNEAYTKNENPYWKFVIDGKTYSLFEYEIGKGIGEGDKVGMFWKEHIGDYKGNKVTFRNLTNIFRKDSAGAVTEEKEKTIPETQNTKSIESLNTKLESIIRGADEKEIKKLLQCLDVYISITEAIGMELPSIIEKIKKIEGENNGNGSS